MSGRLEVGLVEACEDPGLFDIPLWPRQRELLEAVERGGRAHVWCLGRRSGKSTMCAVVGLHDATLRPRLDRYVRPRERRHVVAVATTRRQAGLVLEAARSIVARSKLLRGLLVGENEDELEFSTGAVFSAFPCTARAGRGWAISTLLMDEAAFFLDGEGNSAAEAVWQALEPGTLQFGPDARIIVSSTPWGDSGLFATLYRQASSGELEDAVAQHATTAEMNVTIDPAWLAREERRDPEAFKSEYLAQFAGSGGAFFDPDAIRMSVTLPGELKPGDGVGWIAGLDPAFSSDPFGLVVVGQDARDRRRLLVGHVRSWRQEARKKARSLDETREVEDTVLAEVASVIRLFGARAVTDQYKSAGVVERLLRLGINVRAEPMTAPMKDSAFGFLRGRLNEGSIELYEHPQLLRELRAVSTRYGAGRSSVVLPRIGGTHGDLAQALAIAVLEHDKYASRPTRATFGRPQVLAGSGGLASARDEEVLARVFGLGPDQIFRGRP